MLTQLVNYDYYTDNYEGSSIPESSFNSLSIRASTYVNKNTYNRITDGIIDDNIRNCTCEIADLLYSQDIKKLKIEDNKIVASETVGKLSKPYINNSSLIDKQILNENELEASCYKICYRYLVSTGLMCRCL